MILKKLLAAGAAGSALIAFGSVAGFAAGSPGTQGAFDGIDAQLQPSAAGQNNSLATLAQQTEALAAEIAALQASGFGAQAARLAQLVRVVSQLADAIAAETASPNPGQAAFLAAEFESLKTQLAQLKVKISATVCVSSLPAVGWTSTSGLKYQVSVVDKQIVRIRVGGQALPENASWAVQQAARKPLVCEVASGQAGSQILKTANLSVAADGQSLLTVSDNSGNVLWKDAAAPTFDTGASGNGSLKLTGSIPEGSSFYGLGDKYPNGTTNGVIPVNRAGGSFLLWTAEPGQNGNYRHIPFHIRRTSNTYTGYFLDNTWRQTYDFGKTAQGTLTIGAEGGGIDYYVIAGGSPKEILANYAKLTGATPMQPLWSYGWQQSKWNYESAQWITDNIIKGTPSGNAGYRKLGIPADAIWLDIQFQHANRPFTVDTSSKYSGLDKVIKDWSDEDFKTIVITDLHVAATEDATGSAATANTPATTVTGASAYAEARGKGYFLKNADGVTEYQARVWPFNSSVPTLSVFPDFTNKLARDWWGALTKPFYTTFGVAGFWNDMNEPVAFNGDNNIVPTDKVGRIEEPGFQSRSVTQKEVHNIVGMQNTRGSYEGLLAIKPDQRPFVMTRASYAGGQRYAVTWTGDNGSGWSDLRIATNNITDLGLAGFTAGADIGGYAGSESSDLLTRWTQIGSFYPISRNHSESGSQMQEPWVNVTAANVGGPLDDLAIRRKYIRNRYALMPYLYTLGEETSRTGTPIMRRMFLEFPTANAPGASSTVPLDVAAETQFMVGPSLLVAPSPIEQGFKPSVPPSLPFGQAIEAEKTQLSGGASTNTNHTGASGGRFVDKLETVGAQMSATLTEVPSDGAYTFQVRYANGGQVNNLPLTRTLSVLVNGVGIGRVNLPALANWDSWSTASLTVPLKAGSNVVTLAYAAGDTAFVNVDSFGVTQTNAPFPTTLAVVSVSQSNMPYDVLLPPGAWYDYWTGKAVPAPATGTASSWTYNLANPGIADLPVFVRAGSIIPRVPQAAVAAIKSTVDVAKTPTLELVVYPGDNCSGTVYADDGNSFAFKKGAYYRRAYSCTVSGNQVTVNFGAVEGSFKPSWSNVNVTVAGSTTMQTVAEAATASSITLPIPTE